MICENPFLPLDWYSTRTEGFPLIVYRFPTNDRDTTKIKSNYQKTFLIIVQKFVNDSFSFTILWSKYFIELRLVVPRFNYTTSRLLRHPKKHFWNGIQLYIQFFIVIITFRKKKNMVIHYYSFKIMFMKIIITYTIIFLCILFNKSVTYWIQFIIHLRYLLIHSIYLLWKKKNTFFWILHTLIQQKIDVWMR